MDWKCRRASWIESIWVKSRHCCLVWIRLCQLAFTESDVFCDRGAKIGSCLRQKSWRRRLLLSPTSHCAARYDSKTRHMMCRARYWENNRRVDLFLFMLIRWAREQSVLGWTRPNHWQTFSRNSWSHGRLLPTWNTCRGEQYITITTAAIKIPPFLCIFACAPHLWMECESGHRGFNR